jgi:hypothetical protein
VAVRRGRTLLVEARAATPQTSRRLEEQSRQLQRGPGVHGAASWRTGARTGAGLSGSPPAVEAAAAAQESLEIWDGPYLSARAGRLDIVVPPGTAPGE